MDTYDLARESLQLAKKDLALNEDINLTESDDPFRTLHNFLRHQIQYLLDHDFNRLLISMYRIDVSEKKVKEILELAEPGKIADNLALVVIEREKQKVFTRKKYTF